MKLLLLGGSNTVMTRGYVYHLMDVMKNTKGTEIEALNLAVGANSCVHGLQIVKNVSNLNQFSDIIVEYSINDFSLASAEAWGTWKRAYEGLVRYILLTHPGANIYLLLFGRRTKGDGSRMEGIIKDRQRRMYAHLEALVRLYAGNFSIQIIPVDAYLGAISKLPGGNFAAFYSDGEHYTMPATTALIANYIANFIRQPAGVKDRPALPPALQGGTWEGAGLLDVVRESPAQQRVIHANSRYRKESVALLDGESLEFSVPGSLISLSFVSAPEGGCLMVEEEGESPFTFDTHHVRTGEDKFPFLIKTLVLDWKNWGGRGDVGSRRIKVTAISNQEAARREIRHVKRFNMQESPLPIPARRVYIDQMMFTQDMDSKKH